MSFVYVTTYIRQVDNIAQSTALDINTVAMLVSLVLIPLLGALSDRVGRKPILIAVTGAVRTGVAAVLDVAPPRNLVGSSSSDRICRIGSLFWRRCSNSNGRVGARPGPVHRTVRGLQHRNGVSWRLNTVGRGLHHQAQSIRPLTGLPAD